MFGWEGGIFFCFFFFFKQKTAYEMAQCDWSSDVCSSDLGGYTPTGSLSIHLGSGDGTFGPGSKYAAGADPRAVIAVDLNGDRHLDLVVADHDYFTLGGLSILLGHGDGTFAPEV